MKITSIIYKSLLSLYGLLPCKKQICLLLKASKIPNNKFYLDLKFNGVFTAKINAHDQFKLFHYGGTIENEIFWKGLSKSWEPETIWLWEECCRFSKVIFDIGANTGVYSLIAKSINQDSKVIAFEPSNNTFYKLAKNNSLNGFDIRCENLALSNKCGAAIFYDVLKPNQTSASLDFKMLKDDPTVKLVEYEVTIETLEHFAYRKGIERIDLIKIDVELHEKEVLEGFGNILFKSQPVIFIEVLTAEVAHSLNEIFKTQAYRIFHLKGYKEAVEVDEFSLFPYLYNFFVFPKAKSALIESKTTLLKKSNP